MASNAALAPSGRQTQQTSFLASPIKALSDICAWSTRKRRVKSNGGSLKLNLGCSISVCEGWVNIDGSHHILFRKLPEPLLGMLYEHSQMREVLPKQEYVRRLRQNEFVHHNLNYGIPFENESADYIYTSHFLEHLYPETSRFLLQEIYRTLKPGGRIRICVPDLQHAVELYQRGQKQAFLEYFFLPSTAHAYERHRNMFDFDTLSSILCEVGYANIERCAYRKGCVPNLDKLDNRPDETLYVEATK
jgi:SAM-dependent methyltransferase